MLLRTAIRLAAAMLFGLSQAAAAAEPTTLTIAVGGAFTSMDPHYFNLGPNNALSSHVFEPLVRFDPKYNPAPGLAVSWRAIDDNTWEFRLREGVTFHDGTPFTAADVVFSFARVPTIVASPSSFNFAVKPIVATEVVDPRTLRLRTAAPVPLMPYNLTTVRIVSSRLADGMTTASFNSLRSAIGTGPFRVIAFTVGEHATLQRNEAWWDQKPYWATVQYRLIADNASRIAALRAGEVDIIDQVPTRDVADLNTNPRIGVVSTPGQRLIYLAPDASRAVTPFAFDTDGRPSRSNPLRDPRVRRALSLAINREALKDHVMDGFSAPTGQLMPEEASGHDPTIAPDPYEPERARRLLAEAGYPSGFAITLHGPNNRYVNDQKLVEAIAQMWTRVGVVTTVEVMPAATFFARALRSEFSVRLTGWGSSTGEASSSLIELLASSNPEKGRGAVFQPEKYANPRVDEIIEQALATVDTGRREALYLRAERLALPDLPIIPLHHQVNVYAVRAGLVFHARMEERVYAWDITPR